MDSSQRCHPSHGTPLAVDENTYEPITTKQDCDPLIDDEKARWEGPEEGGYCEMTERHPEYAGNLTFCMLTSNTGNSASILGAFSLLKNMSCALENSGMTWHQSKPATPETKTVKFDTSCFDKSDLKEICGYESEEEAAQGCNFQASVSAYLNPDSYYDARMILSLSSDKEGEEWSVSYDAKIKSTDTVSEIAVNMVGASHPMQMDAYAAKYDAAKNAFTYEGRFDRIESSADDSGGWSRHIRVYADLTNSGELLPENVEVAYANLYKGLSPDPRYSATIATLKGSATSESSPGITGQVLGRHISADSADDADMQAALDAAIDYSLFDEEDQDLKLTYCYTSDSRTEGECEPGSALEVPYTGKLGFFLPGGDYRKTSTPNYDNGEYLRNTEWFESLTGIKFTSVDLTKPEP